MLRYLKYEGPGQVIERLVAELAALRRGPARAPGVEELAGEFLVEVGALVTVRTQISEVEVAHIPYLGRLHANLMALSLHVT